MLQPSFRLMKILCELGQHIAGHIRQVNFHVAPDPLGGVQFWSISWKAFQMKSVCSSIGEVSLDPLGSMDGTPIPNHEQQTRDLALQIIQELNHLLGRNGMFISFQEQFPLGGDPGNGRQMIAQQVFFQDRRQTPRCIAAHHHGQQVEPGFVYEDDDSPFFAGLFLSSGQRSCHQRSISSGLRCLACTNGFWGVQPNSLRMRLTWAGWYRTPSSPWISLATRGFVHTAPRNPKASAPFASIFTNRRRSAWLSRTGRPVLGGVFRASTPPSWARLIHWLTAPRVTPNASAISFCCQPDSCKAQARFRRSTFQSVFSFGVMNPI